MTRYRLFTLIAPLLVVTGYRYSYVVAILVIRVDFDLWLRSFWNYIFPIRSADSPLRWTPHVLRWNRTLPHCPTHTACWMPVGFGYGIPVDLRLTT